MFTLKSLFTVANMEHGENLDQEELIQWFTTYLQSGKRTSFPTQNRLSASLSLRLSREFGPRMKNSTWSNTQFSVTSLSAASEFCCQLFNILLY